MADEQKHATSPITSGLIWVAQVTGAGAIGWLLSKTGLYEAFFDVFAASFIFILAGLALFIFALPFLKHLPPMPRLLPESVTHIVSRPLLWVLMAWNIGALFAQDQATPTLFGIFFLALIAGFILAVRAERRGDAEQTL